MYERRAFSDNGTNSHVCCRGEVSASSIKFQQIVVAESKSPPKSKHDYMSRPHLAFAHPGIMAASMCFRCLRRSLYDIDVSTTVHQRVQRAAFSSSSSLAGNPPKKKPVTGNRVASARPGRTLRLSKKKRTATGRPPAEGERKALRKRVVLNNTNALEVPGLRDLDRSRLSSDRLQEAQDKVLGLQNDTVEALRSLNAFQPTQAWKFFQRPATLIRKETLELAKEINRIAEKQGGDVVRRVILGDRGSGKSVLQLQALAMASLKRWFVVHLPEAKDLTNAHESYQPAAGPDGVTYIQPHYTATLLGNIRKANAALLSELTLTMQHDLPVTLPPGTTLSGLIDIGLRDPELAWPIWQALWKEMLSPSVENEATASRPPIMLTLDGLHHVMRLTSYLSADMESVHAHELALVKHFVNLLSGRTALPNGGMVIAATSESNRASAMTLDHAITRNLAVQHGRTPLEWDPYVAHDKWVQDAMETVNVQKLEGLSKAEARGIMEYYAQSGMLRSAVTDGLVNEKWTLSGGGIIAQIEKGTVRASI